MPASLTPLAEKVCLGVGHSIESLTNILYDPINKVSLPPATWIGCVRCGMSLDEIRTVKIPLKRAKRVKSEPATESAIPV